MVKESGRKFIAQNRKARHDYAIEDVFEAGLVLTGTEVKSLRAGRASLVDSFAQVKDGEVWVSKGYGHADITAGTPVEADTTIFPTASVAKLFT